MRNKGQEAMQSVTKEPSVVDALASIEIRIDACRSITGCILEYMPTSNTDRTAEFYFNEIGNLASALGDVLDLCREDIKLAYDLLDQGANHE